VLVAVLAVTIWFLPFWATAALAAIAAGIGGAELAGISARAGAPVSPVFTGGAAALVSLSLAARGHGVPGAESAPVAVVLALVIAAGALALAQGPPSPSTVTRAAMLVMAPIYVGAPLGAIAWIQGTSGPGATSWLIALTAASDTAQFVTGRALGRRKLAPSVSPAKTVEGAAGGLVVAGAVGFALARVWLPALQPAFAAALAMLLAVVGMVGDLFESALKRSAGVKDSSHLIPGHGGLLDRVDSYLFAGPAFCLVLLYLG